MEIYRKCYSNKDSKYNLVDIRNIRDINNANKKEYQEIPIQRINSLHGLTSIERQMFEKEYSSNNK